MTNNLLDGTGKGYRAKVDVANRVHTRSVTISAEQQATIDGDSYNINTGIINISGTSASSILYFKNSEDRNYIITAIALGVGAGTASDSGELTLIENPTGGDLITDGTAVSINRNRNAGSGKVLAADIYKGKDGGTVTGGDDTALFFQGTSGRLFAAFPFVVPKNKSIALKYDPNLSSGSVNVYAALIGHLEVAV